MDGLVAIIGLTGLTILSVSALIWAVIWGVERKYDAKLQLQKSAQKAAIALRSRRYGADLLRSLRGGRDQ